MSFRTESRPRVTDASLAAVAARVTARDRYLCRVLAEHSVLTTTQIADLTFASVNAATHRLVTLYRLRLLERFRPLTPVGSAPYHYVLDQLGAAILAAEDGRDLSEVGYRRDKALAIAHSQRLAHLVGANGFFTGLVAHARHTTAELAEWWSERRCVATWGEVVRPDGYGRWHHGEATLEFFLEYDRGTEPLDRVADKLDGYARLAVTSGITTPVLFWITGARREAEIRRAIADATVPVATACPLLGLPAEHVWLPAGGRPDDRTEQTPGSSPRCRLSELASVLNVTQAGGS